MAFSFETRHEDFLARLTEAAYQVVLRQGLRRSFVDVKLELWREIRQAAQFDLAPAQRPLPRQAETFTRSIALVEVA